MFTEYNPAFWPINLGRDLNRSVKLLKGARYADLAGMSKSSLLKYYFKAVYQQNKPEPSWGHRASLLKTKIQDGQTNTQTD